MSTTEQPQKKKMTVVRISNPTHPWYGLFCVVLYRLRDGYLRCRPLNGDNEFYVLYNDTSYMGKW